MIVINLGEVCAWLSRSDGGAGRAARLSPLRCVHAVCGRCRARRAGSCGGMHAVSTLVQKVQAIAVDPKHLTGKVDVAAHRRGCGDVLDGVCGGAGSDSSTWASRCRCVRPWARAGLCMSRACWSEAARSLVHLCLCVVLDTDILPPTIRLTLTNKLGFRRTWALTVVVVSSACAQGARTGTRYMD